MFGWIEHVCDWEQHRRDGLDFPLRPPEDAIEPGEMPTSIVALTVAGASSAQDDRTEDVTGLLEAVSVFYICGEGHGGIGRRLRAWEIHNEVSLAQAPLFVSRVPGQLMDATNAGAIRLAVEALVEKHGAPSLVIVDTMHRNFGAGDENTAADLGTFLNNVDVQIRKPLNCAILIVHHTGHMATDRSRGSSSIRAAMDHEFQLEGTQGVRTLNATKMKEGVAPPRAGTSAEQHPGDRRRAAGNFAGA